MPLIRAIGRWALTGLVINYIIGGGIFGLPSELNRLLGPASPLAMLLGTVVMCIIMACAVEVSSQFADPGGAYLYARRAFGRFAGLLIAWFWLLAVVGGVAAIANVFVSYLGGIVPAVATGSARGLTTVVLIAIPTVINCLGVRSGAVLSGVLALAKLLPLGLLIGFGLTHGAPMQAAPHAAPGLSAWFTALLSMLFAYGGWEDALVPSGEVKDPQRILPFALVAGLVTSGLIYTLLQYVTVRTIGTVTSDHPLADLGAVVLGASGRTFVSIAAMLSTYGYIAAAFVSAPRLPYALAIEGDGPRVLATLHPRFQTPVYPIVGFAVVASALAVSGTFLWALALSGGSMAIVYASVCASLIQLRRVQPAASGIRIPGGPVLAVSGLVLCVVLLGQLDIRHALLMLVTVALASANWLWAAAQRRTVVE